VQAEAHDEAAEVVQEDDQVDASPRARQDEARDVRLPQLSGTRALETPRAWSLAPGLRPRLCPFDPALVQRACDRGRAHPNTLKAAQEVAHLLEAEFWVAMFGPCDLVADGLGDSSVADRAGFGPRCP